MPDAFRLGPLTLPLAPLALLLGGYLFYWLAGGEQERVTGRLIGGALLGAKLIEVLRSPLSFVGSPRLLIALPVGSWALLGALVGAVLWTAPLFWGRWRQLLPVADALTVPLLVGLAVASVGGALPLAAGFGLAAGLAAYLRRLARAPGQMALAGVVLGATAFVVADFFRPAVSLYGGISPAQGIAAILALLGYLGARKLAVK